MAQSKALEIWNGLPTWAKGVIAVGGVAIVYFTTKTIFKKIKGKRDLKNQQETLNAQNADIRNLQNTGVRASYPDSQYKSWADSIQNQFDGCDYGQNVFSADVPIIGYWSSSGKKVKDIFDKLKNDLDYLKLSQAWGIRTYDQCGWGTGDVTGNLSYAISDELDRGEIMGLNNLLAKKGISYRL